MGFADALAAGMGACEMEVVVVSHAIVIPPFRTSAGNPYCADGGPTFVPRAQQRMLRIIADTHVFAEVERRSCLMLVDRMPLRLSRMLDTATRHGRSLMVCWLEL